MRSLGPWLLLGAWGAIVAFGLVAWLDPPWLRELARPGRQTEAEAYVNWGDARARAGDFQRALYWYGRALELTPGDAGATVNSAVALGRLGRPEEGEARLRTLLDSGAPQRALLLYNLGELALRRLDWDGAARWYEEALAEGGWPQLAASRLGDVHARRGDLQRARDALREAVRLWPDPAVHYHSMLLATAQTAPPDAPWLPTVQAVLARGVSGADLAPYDAELHRRLLEADPELAHIRARLAALDE